MNLDATEPSSDTGRSLRKRPANVDAQPRKRRSKNKDEFLNASVEDVYLQTNTKLSEFRPTSLETIYELPKGESEGLRDCMGAVKLKRQCMFTSFYNPSKCKVKMRKNKSRSLKRIGGVKSTQSSFNITLEHVQRVLEDISDDENNEPFTSARFKIPVNTNLDLQSNKEELNISEVKDCKNDIYSLSSSLLEMNMDLEHTHNRESESTTDVSNMGLTKENNTKTFLEHEMQFDELGVSPRKIIIDKSKRNRRRSGRIQPLSLINRYELSSVDIKETPSETLSHIGSKNKFEPENHNSNYNNNTRLSIQPFCEPVQPLSDPLPSEKMDVTVPTLHFNATTTTCAPSTGISLPKEAPPLSLEKGSTKTKQIRKRGKQKTRRVSGINRSLYRTVLNVSSNESSPNTSPSEPFSRRVLSPSSLLEQLNIHSPELIKCPKNPRRKSARLSIGKKESLLGSMWTQKRTPEKITEDDEHSAFNPLPQSSSQVHAANNCITATPDNTSTLNHPIQENAMLTIQQDCNKVDQQTLNSNSLLQTSPPNIRPSPSLPLPSHENPPPSSSSENAAVSFKSAYEFDSPIISGIIGCQARLLKNNKFVVMKGSKINLKQFSTEHH